MIKKIKDNIWQLTFKSFGSVVYLLKLDGKNVLIDTGSLENREELLEELKKLDLSPEEINIVFLTHGHYDHVGNIELFDKAKIYGSGEDFDCERIIEINKQPIKEIKIIKTPGHTFGSVCFYMPEEKILFSGDTLFHNHGIGRTDFPNSSPRDMQSSLDELENLEIKVLCPGHVD